MYYYDNDNILMLLPARVHEFIKSEAKKLERMTIAETDEFRPLYRVSQGDASNFDNIFNSSLMETMPEVTMENILKAVINTAGEYLDLKEESGQNFFAFKQGEKAKSFEVDFYVQAKRRINTTSYNLPSKDSVDHIITAVHDIIMSLAKSKSKRMQHTDDPDGKAVGQGYGSIARQMLLLDEECKDFKGEIPSPGITTSSQHISSYTNKFGFFPCDKMGFNGVAASSQLAYNNLVDLQDKYDKIYSPPEEEETVEKLEPKSTSPEKGKRAKLSTQEQAKKIKTRSTANFDDVIQRGELPVTRCRTIDFLMSMNSFTTIHGENKSNQTLSMHNRNIDADELLKVHISAAIALNLIDVTMGIVTSYSTCYVVKYALRNKSIIYYPERVVLMDTAETDKDKALDKLHSALFVIVRAIYRHNKYVMSRFDEMTDHLKFGPCYKPSGIFDKIPRYQDVDINASRITTDPTRVTLGQLTNANKSIFRKYNPYFQRDLNTLIAVHGSTQSLSIMQNLALEKYVDECRVLEMKDLVVDESSEGPAKKVHKDTDSAGTSNQ